MYHWQIHCVQWFLYACLAYSAVVLTKSQHSLVYRSINRTRYFSWRYFVHSKVLIYVTLLLDVEWIICDFCSKFLISLLCHVWDHIYVLLLGGDVPVVNDIIGTFFVQMLGSSSVGWFCKCFKRVHIRQLRIFWVIIIFCIEVKTSGIRRLVSWLLGTKFVYLAVPTQNYAELAKVHE